MVAEWASAVGGTVVALAGLAFSWHSSRRSEARAVALAQTANEHSRELAELTYAHSRSLERLRLDEQDQQQRWVRAAEAYAEIAETVIRAARDIEEPDDKDLTRTLALVALHADPSVREAFDAWHDWYQKAVFAIDRLSRHDSPQSPWRRQVVDGRLREADAREQLLTAMAEHLAPAANVPIKTN
jgi:hypothetical protein